VGERGENIQEGKKRKNKRRRKSDYDNDGDGERGENSQCPLKKGRG
jgi:hypothetical protein